MSVRPEVLAFVELGTLPSLENAVEASVERHQSLLSLIRTPVSVEEARCLVNAFGPDECFGLAWTLLHLIETAPAPVLEERPSHTANGWVRLLWERSLAGLEVT